MLKALAITGALIAPSPFIHAPMEEPHGDAIPEKNPAPEVMEQLEQTRIEMEREAAMEEQKRKQAEREAQEKKAVSEWKDGVFTAYYPAQDQMQGGFITTSGYDLRNGLDYQGYRVVAAPKEITLYSILDIEIEGYSFKAIVLDRGGAIKGNKFDVTFSDRSTALEFGKKKGHYRIIREGK